MLSTAAGYLKNQARERLATPLTAVQITDLLDNLDAYDREVLEATNLGRISNNGFAPLTIEERRSIDLLLKGGFVEVIRLKTIVARSAFDKLPANVQRYDLRGLTLASVLTVRGGVEILDIPATYGITDRGLEALLNLSSIGGDL